MAMHRALYDMCDNAMSIGADLLVLDKEASLFCHAHMPPFIHCQQFYDITLGGST
jgi:hypothetical protein